MILLKCLVEQHTKQLASVVQSILTELVGREANITDFEINSVPPEQIDSCRYCEKQRVLEELNKLKKWTKKMERIINYV